MGNINRRTIVAPLAAFTMAWILFAYTRASIQTAKVNAHMEREKLFSQHHNQVLEEQRRAAAEAAAAAAAATAAAVEKGQRSAEAAEKK
ncbi:hypothetical protein QBC37DRAFT_409591 [Rhypophila decipiens]|uniref:Uncharacterized protein n=1 Tax=Rhypophila decipiens TaxID=261697 RepID=A0AAN7BFP9_9PEZI|nr:hypothetical protein QBC37DRAFT_409591 [Rhypophila decipiens]